MSGPVREQGREDGVPTPIHDSLYVRVRSVEVRSRRPWTPTHTSCDPSPFRRGAGRGEARRVGRTGGRHSLNRGPRAVVTTLCRPYKTPLEGRWSLRRRISPTHRNSDLNDLLRNPEGGPASSRGAHDSPKTRYAESRGSRHALTLGPGLSCLRDCGEGGPRSGFGSDDTTSSCSRKVW